MSRSNEAMIIVGRKHTGKSTLANVIATEFAKKNPEKRALIVNVNASPAYDKHPYISYEGMKRWKKGCYQFYDRDHEKMFDHFMEVFDPRTKKFNGLFCFEDCTKYIDPHPDKKIKAFLVDHRMWNADMLFTFHSLMSVPPFFWKMTSRVIILKTQDVIDSSFAKRIPNWKEVGPAHERVMKNENNYYHEVVSTLI
jgi:hypothetical protein